MRCLWWFGIILSQYATLPTVVLLPDRFINVVYLSGTTFFGTSEHGSIYKVTLRDKGSELLEFLHRGATRTACLGTVDETTLLFGAVDSMTLHLYNADTGTGKIRDKLDVMKSLVGGDTARTTCVTCNSKMEHGSYLHMDRPGHKFAAFSVTSLIMDRDTLIVVTGDGRLLRKRQHQQFAELHRAHSELPSENWLTLQHPHTVKKSTQPHTLLIYDKVRHSIAHISSEDNWHTYVINRETGIPYTCEVSQFSTFVAAPSNNNSLYDTLYFFCQGGASPQKDGITVLLQQTTPKIALAADHESDNDKHTSTDDEASVTHPSSPTTSESEETEHSAEPITGDKLTFATKDPAWAAIAVLMTVLFACAIALCAYEKVSEKKRTRRNEERIDELRQRVGMVPISYRGAQPDMAFRQIGTGTPNSLPLDDIYEHYDTYEHYQYSQYGSNSPTSLLNTDPSLLTQNVTTSAVYYY